MKRIIKLFADHLPFIHSSIHPSFRVGAGSLWPKKFPSDNVASSKTQQEFCPCKLYYIKSIECLHTSVEGLGIKKACVPVLLV
jgi:hypothetical protein